MNVALLFDYINHRGEDHKYLMDPLNTELILYGPMPGANKDPSVSDGWHWVLHGLVRERDNVPRPTERRTFLLTKLRNVKEVVGGPPT